MDSSAPDGAANDDRAGLLILAGDSVTDCGRDRTDDASYGTGWACMVSEGLTQTPVLNRGISGNRVRDLQARWDADVTSHRPHTVAIMIGINDTWRRYDRDDPTSTEDFGRSYADLLTRTRSCGAARIILLEPILVPVREEQWSWREDLDPKITMMRRLAVEYACEIVPTDAIMNAAAPSLPTGALAADGVHPTPLGHQLIADAFLADYLAS